MSEKKAWWKFDFLRKATEPQSFEPTEEQKVEFFKQYRSDLVSEMLGQFYKFLDLQSLFEEQPLDSGFDAILKWATPIGLLIVIIKLFTMK